MNPKIGLALGSGGARGWAHIGVIERLAQLGVIPDIVCGSSIGALVGAAFAAGKLPALKARLANFGWREIAPLIDVQLTAGGLIEGRKIEGFLAGLGIGGTIEDLPMRYAAVATDLATGREVWLQSGELVHSVRASIGVPGVFSPAKQTESEGWLLDGGLVNPVPVSLARALGADIVIAVDLNSELLGRRFTGLNEAPAPTAAQVPEGLPQALKDLVHPWFANLARARPVSPSYLEVLANSLNIMQDHITRARLAGDPPHVHLRPQLRDFSWLDFHRSKAAVAEGIACVQPAESLILQYCRRAGPASG